MNTSLNIFSSYKDEGSFIEPRNRRQKRKQRLIENKKKREKEKEEEKDKDKEKKEKENTNTKAGEDAEVCRHFTRNNNCRFGISGKGCIFFHPKVCIKFKKGGSGRQGCQKGRNCPLFHQRICRSSLQGVSCSRPKGQCNYIHPRFQRDGNRKYVNNIQGRAFLGAGQGLNPWAHEYQSQTNLQKPKPVQSAQPQTHLKTSGVYISVIASEVVKILQRMNVGAHGERGEIGPLFNPKLQK